MTDDEPINMDALLLAEVAREDPLTRFIAPLPNDEPMRLRAHCEETIQLRREFEINAGKVLCGGYEEARQAAEWIQHYAHEVAYRWTKLRATAVQWAERDVTSLRFRVPL